MKKNDLLYIALGLSVGAGVYYMGKSKIMKNLFATDVLDNKGMLSDKTKSIINTSQKAPNDYWLKEGVEGDNNVFYDDKGNKIMYDKDGNVKIGFWDSVKNGLESLIFWK